MRCIFFFCIKYAMGMAPFSLTVNGSEAGFPSRRRPCRVLMPVLDVNNAAPVNLQVGSSATLSARVSFSQLSIERVMYYVFLRQPALSLMLFFQFSMRVSEHVGVLINNYRQTEASIFP